MRKFFCDECGKEIDAEDVTLLSINISLSTSLMNQYGYSNKDATVDICPYCAHKCIEKIIR